MMLCKTHLHEKFNMQLYSKSYLSRLKFHSKVRTRPFLRVILTHTKSWKSVYITYGFKSIEITIMHIELKTQFKSSKSSTCETRQYLYNGNNQDYGHICPQEFLSYTDPSVWVLPIIGNHPGGGSLHLVGLIRSHASEDANISQRYHTVHRTLCYLYGTTYSVDPYHIWILMPGLETHARAYLIGDT